MKIVRSTAPVTYGDREKKTAIIALSASLEWQEHLNRYRVTVRDYAVHDVINPAPGEPLKMYELIKEKPVFRTKEQVDGLFNYFAQDIVQGDSFTDSLSILVVKSVLLDTQGKPIYGLDPNQLEIVDTLTEIAPEI